MSARDCSLCGTQEPAAHTKYNGWYRNRRGEWFCCRSHRDQSNKMLREFLNNNPNPSNWRIPMPEKVKP